MTARFYYSPRSCALASHIVLEHVGADFEAIRLDFQANQQRSAEYLAINAKGRVPALVTERGVITETPAILLYLAQTHPQSGVAPLDDPFALAELQAVNSWFCSTVHVVHAHGTRGARWADEASALQAMKAKVAQNMTDCVDWIERELLRLRRIREKSIDRISRDRRWRDARERLERPPFPILIRHLRLVARRRLARDERRIIGRTEVDPRRNLRDHLIRQLRVFRRHRRVVLVPDQFHHPTLVCVERFHRRSLRPAVQQPLARREIKVTLRLLAAVAFHAMLAQQRPHVVAKHLQPASHLLRVIRRHVRRRRSIRQRERWKQQGESEWDDCFHDLRFAG